MYVTVGGSGTRLKPISPKDKQLLYYKDKRIIDWIFDICPQAQLLGDVKTGSRKETLQEIKHQTDVVIIDCDIIPFELNLSEFINDTVYVFNSDKNKYGSVVIENGKIKSSSEKNNISTTKCSGVYCIKNMEQLLNKMNDDNSIVSGMYGADVIYENTFLRFGDLEDYCESIQN